MHRLYHWTIALLLVSQEFAFRVSYKSETNATVHAAINPVKSLLVPGLLATAGAYRVGGALSRAHPQSSMLAPGMHRSARTGPLSLSAALQERAPMESSLQAASREDTHDLFDIGARSNHVDHTLLFNLTGDSGSSLGERLVNLNVMIVLKRLQGMSLQAENHVPDNFAEDEDADTYRKRMRGSSSLLEQMEHNISLASTEVFTLVPKSSADEKGDSIESIYAIAEVAKRSLEDDYGNLREIAHNQGLDVTGSQDRLPALDISGIVVPPSHMAEGGLGKELILRIIHRAAARGLMVTLSPVNKRLEEYYASIGFIPVDYFSNEMVFAGDIPMHTEKESRFDLGIFADIR